ncbi:MAG: hypothetical protein K9L66_05755 [Spirochaetaceae bacterium]|nr:hypothetical protein [Spirochaetaceae bacterium]MCF7938750.1 hypothetical protein [Spirochaetales bacterium]
MAKIVKGVNRPRYKNIIKNSYLKVLAPTVLTYKKIFNIKESSEYADRPRVFCIGLNKTATSSLHAAFLMLGYSSLHQSYTAEKMLHKAIMKNKKLLHYMQQYDVFSDYPYFRYFKELDMQYPGSKFILNTRNREEWIKSRISHDNRWNKKYPHKTPRPVDEAQAEKLGNFFDAVHRDIREYFTGRSDFLEYDVTTGDAWDKLCSFLSLPIPNEKFPHECKYRS